MNLLRAFQIIDDSGRLQIPLFLVLGWIFYIIISPAPGLFHAALGIALLINLQADRFLKAMEVKKLHAAELERITKLEAELGEIRGALSIATQRTMF